MTAPTTRARTSPGLALGLVLGLALLGLWRVRATRDVGPEVRPRGGEESSPAAAIPVPMVLPSRGRVVAPGPQREPAPQEEPTWEGDGLPPDPVERGPAALHLALRDAETGAPRASRVELWRIDAPASEWWTRGDQLQVEVDLPEAGLALEGLPEGVYRLVPHEQPRSDEPLSAFEVRAPSTVVSFALRPRSSFEVWLHLVDAEGRPVEQRLRRRMRWSYGPHEEPWRVARTCRDARWGFGRGFGGGSSSGSHGSGPVPGRGYALGRWSEPARGDGGPPALVLDAGAGCQVEVDLDVRGVQELHLTAVRLDREALLERVASPAGLPLEGLAIEITAEAVRRDPQGPGLEWRAAPVRIEVSAEGCAPWRGTWRPLEGQLPWIELVAQR